MPILLVCSKYTDTGNGCSYSGIMLWRYQLFTLFEVKFDLMVFLDKK